MKHLVCPHCLGVNRVPEQRLNEKPQCGHCKRALLTGEPMNLDAAGFDKFVQRSELPLLVDFWAPWCGPCKSMAPAFEAAAQRLLPRVQLAKVNTEQQQALAGAQHIRSIPTLVLYKNGAEVARVSGAMDAAHLVAWTEQQL